MGNKPIKVQDVKILIALYMTTIKKGLNATDLIKLNQLIDATFYDIPLPSDYEKEHNAKMFWLWCFLHGEKVTGYYSIEERVDKMYKEFKQSK